MNKPSNLILNIEKMNAANLSKQGIKNHNLFVCPLRLKPF